MTFEFGIIKLLKSIFHVLTSEIFHNTRTIFENIWVTNITSFSHVILQILPASSWRQPCNHHPVLTPSCRRTSTSWSASTKTSSSTFWKFYSQSISIIVISIPGIYCIFSIPGIFKFNKCKWWSSTVLQINKYDFSILVKEILNVFAANIWGQVANINSTIISTTWAWHNLSFGINFFYLLHLTINYN